MRKPQSRQRRRQMGSGRPMKSIGRRRLIGGGSSNQTIMSEFALYCDDPNGGWSADCTDQGVIGFCPNLVAPEGKATIVYYD